ncbi:LysR family transcriptional regulator [Corynebacterium nuruki]|uniref:LysR family transcriptional regulator n=1 Tax=Corynebacterium nuruki TaxID=1032851 RepID=UPI0039BFA185
MTITLRQLDYFVAVADAGSITAAAQRLYLSASAVSTTVTELESTLGVRLFTRHARGLSLTGEGRTVLGRARSLLREAEDLEHNATALGSAVSGTLTVGCYSTIAPLLLPRIIAEFAERFPDLTVRFAEGSRSELLEGFALGRFDLLVVYDYPFKDDLPDRGTLLPLGAFPPYVLLPDAHRLAGTGPVALADLAEDPLILFDLEPADQYFLSLFGAEGVEPDVRYRTGDFEVIRGLVARGLGYSLLTQRTLQPVSYEGISYVPAELACDHGPLNVVALVPSASRLTERSQAFVGAARDILADPVRYPNR